MGGVGDVAAGGELVADLDGAPAAGAFESGAHLLGMVHREGHGLFLVDVLAGVERGDEVLGVKVLRSGDEDGVDGRIFQEVAIVAMLPGGGRDGARLFQAAGVDVGHAGAFGVGAGEGFAQQFAAAGAGADDAEAHAVVGAEDVGRGQGAGEAGGHFADEITARLHGREVLLVNRATPGYDSNDYSVRREGKFATLQPVENASRVRPAVAPAPRLTARRYIA